MFAEKSNNTEMFEFHIHKDIRKKYSLDASFFSTNGTLIFANFHAVRLFVYKINLLRQPELHVYPGEVNAAGLIEEIYHIILRQYEEQINPGVFAKAETFLIRELGQKRFSDLVLDFVNNFPPTEVFLGKISPGKYLEQSTSGRSNLLITIEEMMMLWFANFNPGNKKLKELFSEIYLADSAGFSIFSEKLEAFFSKEPPFGPDNHDIFTLFRTPVLVHPDNLSAQLDYILDKWKTLLPESIVIQLLKGKDLMKEDVTFGAPGGGPPPLSAPVYKGFGDFTENFTIGKSGYRYFSESTTDYEETEQFTDDAHWMPRVVLLAKNTYVWLDQLSKKYDRDIRRLDQIPDEELDQLAKWNFTGLWLIGIWERSEASRRIKHIMGNTDAVSSAYSLYDYEIAHDLGGEEAYRNLNERAKLRGIRLASDMVPNHTGIYSKWTIEHPEYFIQSALPPFPGYTFNGENLSLHSDFDIKLEDGYYTKTDAAVVFQWVDKRSGQTRYIYHGNDGTSMPWNDTAQLNMLRQEVREAVIQKIFEVARRFSIIRFDAAMTLAKKHFSRLWYPRPGMGGDIPSRADYAMSKEAFDEMFPVEFWREVVDRMNETMPETLLLAEAFWFMEGYFVRTLGMHRVYNSAFMHMLKNEENAKYRDLITNTLEFEPEILKRYVNFMSNPDEETAIRQFGTGDKYFGVCMLMNTLPGLPMFAHGQTEGFAEKYGMEYQRAYYNENPQPWLVEKHEREIFPITRRRYLFSEVEHFNFFDFADNSGAVNENVFAFTNRSGQEKVLVLFNNKYEQAHGRIRHSAPRLSAGDDGKKSQSLAFAEALNLQGSNDIYYIFREHISGLEYLRSGRELSEQGFAWNLNGFEYRLFWDFQELNDATGELFRLHQKLNGDGVQDIRRAAWELRLQPIHEAFEAMFSKELMDSFLTMFSQQSVITKQDTDFSSFTAAYQTLLSKISQEFSVGDKEQDFIQKLQAVEKWLRFLTLKEELLNDRRLNPEKSLLVIDPGFMNREKAIILLVYIIVSNLKKSIAEIPDEDEIVSLLKLQYPLMNLFKSTGAGQDEIIRNILLANILIKYGIGLFDFGHLAEIPLTDEEASIRFKETVGKNAKIALQILEDVNVQSFIGVNTYKEVVYFSKELFILLTNWLCTISILNYFENQDLEENELLLIVSKTLEFRNLTWKISEQSGYQLDILKEKIIEYSKSDE